jgi:nucleoside-diphosphate-sugar epimerase
MSTGLITGDSGFIGKALAASMAHGHCVLCMSRKTLGPRSALGVGEFGLFEDLAQLEKHQIEVDMHLAAVTGGAWSVTACWSMSRGPGA